MLMNNSGLIVKVLDFGEIMGENPDCIKQKEKGQQNRRPTRQVLLYHIFTFFQVFSQKDISKSRNWFIHEILLSDVSHNDLIRFY